MTAKTEAELLTDEAELQRMKAKAEADFKARGLIDAGGDVQAKITPDGAGVEVIFLGHHGYPVITLSNAQLIGRKLFSTLTVEYDEQIVLSNVNFDTRNSLERKRVTDELRSHDTAFVWWDSLIERAVSILEDAINDSDHAADIYSCDVCQPVEYIIGKLIVKDEPNIIFGQPDEGKTILAVFLAAIANLPFTNNPYSLTVGKEPCNILWLDWENSKNRIISRMAELSRGISPGDDETPFMFTYKSLAMPLTENVLNVNRIIKEKNIGLVVIDSLGMAAGGDLKEASSATSFYAALRRIKTTSLIIAHTTKNKEEKAKSIFGSQFFRALARNIWEVKKSEMVAGNELAVALIHDKFNLGPKSEPIGFKFTFDADAIIPTKFDCESAPEVIEKLSITKQILIQLETEGILTINELAEAIETTAQTIRNKLNGLLKASKVRKLTDGRYELCF